MQKIPRDAGSVVHVVRSWKLTNLNMLPQNIILNRTKGEGAFGPFRY
jgi:hypothetical protein